MALLPGEIQSQSVEAAVLEIALLLQKAEASERLNPDKKNNITLTLDVVAEVATIAIRLPIKILAGGSQMRIEGKEYTLHDIIRSEEFLEG
jgi:ABC-type hemin transport system substrate-binding protein